MSLLRRGKRPWILRKSIRCVEEDDAVRDDVAYHMKPPAPEPPRSPEPSLAEEPPPHNSEKKRRSVSLPGAVKMIAAIRRTPRRLPTTSSSSSSSSSKIAKDDDDGDVVPVDPEAQAALEAQAAFESASDRISRARTAGCVVEHDFMAEQLGLKLSLVGGGSRLFVQVQSTRPQSEAHGVIKPSDELIAVNGDLIYGITRARFHDLVVTLGRTTKRPLRLTFVHGRRRDEAFAEQEDRLCKGEEGNPVRTQQSSLPQHAASQDTLHFTQDPLEEVFRCAEKEASEARRTARRRFSLGITTPKTTRFQDETARSKLNTYLREYLEILKQDGSAFVFKIVSGQKIPFTLALATYESSDRKFVVVKKSDTRLQQTRSGSDEQQPQLGDELFVSWDGTLVVDPTSTFVTTLQYSLTTALRPMELTFLRFHAPPISAKFPQKAMPAPAPTPTPLTTKKKAVKRRSSTTKSSASPSTTPTSTKGTKKSKQAIKTAATDESTPETNLRKKKSRSSSTTTARKKSSSKFGKNASDSRGDGGNECPGEGTPPTPPQTMEETARALFPGFFSSHEKITERAAATPATDDNQRKGEQPPSSGGSLFSRLFSENTGQVGTGDARGKDENRIDDPQQDPGTFLFSRLFPPEQTRDNEREDVTSRYSTGGNQAASTGAASAQTSDGLQETLAIEEVEDEGRASFSSVGDRTPTSSSFLPGELKGDMGEESDQYFLKNEGDDDPDPPAPFGSIDMLDVSEAVPELENVEEYDDGGNVATDDGLNHVPSIQPQTCWVYDDEELEAVPAVEDEPTILASVYDAPGGGSAAASESGERVVDKSDDEDSNIRVCVSSPPFHPPTKIEPPDDEASGFEFADIPDDGKDISDFEDDPEHEETMARDSSSDDGIPISPFPPTPQQSDGNLSFIASQKTEELAKPAEKSSHTSTDSQDFWDYWSFATASSFPVVASPAKSEPKDTLTSTTTDAAQRSEDNNDDWHLYSITSPTGERIKHPSVRDRAGKLNERVFEKQTKHQKDARFWSMLYDRRESSSTGLDSSLLFMTGHAKVLAGDPGGDIVNASTAVPQAKPLTHVRDRAIVLDSKVRCKDERGVDGPRAATRTSAGSLSADLLQKFQRPAHDEIAFSRGEKPASATESTAHSREVFESGAELKGMFEAANVRVADLNELPCKSIDDDDTTLRISEGSGVTIHDSSTLIMPDDDTGDLRLSDGSGAPIHDSSTLLASEDDAKNVRSTGRSSVLFASSAMMAPDDDVSSVRSSDRSRPVAASTSTKPSADTTSQCAADDHANPRKEVGGSSTEKKDDLSSVRSSEHSTPIAESTTVTKCSAGASKHQAVTDCTGRRKNELSALCKKRNDVSSPPSDEERTRPIAVSAAFLSPSTDARRPWPADVRADGQKDECIAMIEDDCNASSQRRSPECSRPTVTSIVSTAPGAVGNSQRLAGDGADCQKDECSALTRNSEDVISQQIFGARNPMTKPSADASSQRGGDGGDVYKKDSNGTLTKKIDDESSLRSSECHRPIVASITVIESGAEASNHQAAMDCADRRKDELGPLCCTIHDVSGLPSSGGRTRPIAASTVLPSPSTDAGTKSAADVRANHQKDGGSTLIKDSGNASSLRRSPEHSSAVATSTMLRAPSAVASSQRMADHGADCLKEERSALTRNSEDVTSQQSSGRSGPFTARTTMTNPSADASSMRAVDDGDDLKRDAGGSLMKKSYNARNPEGSRPTAMNTAMCKPSADASSKRLPDEGTDRKVEGIALCKNTADTSCLQRSSECKERSVASTMLMTPSADGIYQRAPDDRTVRKGEINELTDKGDDASGLRRRSERDEAGAASANLMVPSADTSNRRTAHDGFYRKDERSECAKNGSDPSHLRGNSECNRQIAAISTTLTEPRAGESSKRAADHSMERPMLTKKNILDLSDMRLSECSTSIADSTILTKTSAYTTKQRTAEDGANRNDSDDTSSLHGSEHTGGSQGERSASLAAFDDANSIRESEHSGAQKDNIRDQLTTDANSGEFRRLEGSDLLVGDESSTTLTLAHIDGYTSNARRLSKRAQTAQSQTDDFQPSSNEYDRASDDNEAIKIFDSSSLIRVSVDEDGARPADFEGNHFKSVYRESEGYIVRRDPVSGEEEQTGPVPWLTVNFEKDDDGSPPEQPLFYRVQERSAPLVSGVPLARVVTTPPSWFDRMFKFAVCCSTIEDQNSLGAQPPVDLDPVGPRHFD